MGYKNIAPPALFRAKFSQRTSGFPIVHINIENVQKIRVKAPEARGFYKRLSNKFGQSLFMVYRLKNKAFKLNFSAKAFVMS